MKTYNYHFKAYNAITKRFLGEFYWKAITPKEYNNRLKHNVYKTFMLHENEIALNWL